MSRLESIARPTNVLASSMAGSSALPLLGARGYALHWQGDALRATRATDIVGRPLSRRLDDLPSHPVIIVDTDMSADEALDRLEEQGIRYLVLGPFEPGAAHVLAASSDELEAAIRQDCRQARGSEHHWWLCSIGCLSWRLWLRAGVGVAGGGLDPADIDLETLDVTGSPETLLGYTEQDLRALGARWPELVHPDDRGRVESALTSLCASGPTTTEAIRLRRRDGGWAHVRSSLRLIDCGPRGALLSGFVQAPPGAAAEPAGAPGAAPSVEENLALALERSRGPLLVVTEDDIIQYANPAAEELFGPRLELGQRLGLPLSTHGGPAEVDVVTPSGGSVVMELVGSEVEWHGAPARVVTFRDVTARVEEQQAAESMLDAVFRAVPSGILVCEADSGRAVEANPALLGLLGYERVQDLPPWPELKVGGGATGRDASSAQREELELRGRDGSAVPVAVRSARLPSLAGGENLVLYVVEGLAELRRLRLRMAQAEGLATLGMLAAGVAHELNNPLAYVLFNLESAHEDLVAWAVRARRPEASGAGSAGSGRMEAEDLELLEDLAERLGQAVEGARRIREISKSLGAFSRVERFERQPVDLAAVVEHAVRMGFHEVKYRARLVKDLGRVPTLLSSEGRLAQVVLNLLVNAAHAIDEGDAEHNEIRLRTFVEGAQAIIEVSDTGRGIPPEQLERIFEPFFTTKPAGKGTGQGLAISKRIVEELGGNLTVTSQVGQGSSFRVSLPLDAEEPGADGSEEAREPEPARAAAPRGRILVVDDEPLIGRVVQRILGRDHDTVVVGSGAEAMELLGRDAGFDLILCDMMMPVVSGVDLHQWLQEHHPALAASTVFMTGGAFSPKAREHLARTGALQIEKPFDQRALSRLVRDLVLAARSRNGEDQSR